jgi:sortase A
MRRPGTSDDEAQPPCWIRILTAVEWCFLLFGLAALDVYIWTQTSTVVYEAYEDWAFDRDLRGLSAAPLRFAEEEIRALLGREQSRAERPEETRARPQVGPMPESKLPEPKPPTPPALVGRLEIPGLHLVAMVQEGADARTLRRAVGHIPGTALPGLPGNVGLAGHRDTFFRPLRQIRVSDAIQLETQNGTYRYRVQWTQIVGPRDVHVLSSTGGQSLTLVTCYPFYYVGAAPKRFIVRAGLESVVANSATTAAY